MKKSYIIGIILIAVAFGIIISTVSNSSTYASFATATTHEGKVFHVVGKLNKEKPFEYNPRVNANLFGFYLTDNEGKEVKVLYNGSKPQDFEKSEQIVIIGKMAGNEFRAAEILMKCPSKYTESNVQTKNS
ncbi:MAG: cytochrome c maturation protein CcmE [Bacteroidia bacterium]